MKSYINTSLLVQRNFCSGSDQWLIIPRMQSLEILDTCCFSEKYQKSLTVKLPLFYQLMLKLHCKAEVLYPKRGEVCTQISHLHGG